jgi:lysophospholipase L1-like esterase
MQVKVTSSTLVPGQEAPMTFESNDGNINNVIRWGGKHGVRLFPNRTGNIHNHTLSKQDVVIRTNSIGLRGPELGPKQPDEYRILLIGDSIIFCDYVDETISISSLLEQKLKADGVANVKVLNAGLPGANTAGEYHHYQEIAALAQADLVVLAMYLNDSQEPQAFYAKQLRFPFSQSRFLTWLVQRLQLIDSEVLFGSVRLPGVEENWREKFRDGRKLASGNSQSTREGFDFEIYNAHKDFGLAWNPTSWAQISKISTAFSEVVKQNNSKFAAFIFPVAMQVYANADILSTYPQQEFANIFAKLQVPHMDLLPTLRSYSSTMTKEQMFYDHCHYRDAGNRLVADAVAEWLIKDSLVPRASQVH